MTEEQQNDARVDSPGEGNAHTTPTAMAEPAGVSHSPLPWRVGTRNGNDEGAAFGIDCDEWTIADVWADVKELTPAIARANAEFIVRAVNCHDELLAAMRVLSDYYCDDFCSGGLAPGDGIRHTLKCRQYRAAIAKAEGR